MNIEEIGLTVLLLASQARLLELFRSLEAQGMLQLQVASSITDAERLLAGPPPDFAFVQSRVSALSGEIMVRHIRSLVADNSKVVLLSGDEEELRKAPGLQALALSLASSDDSLRFAVRELLSAAEPARDPVEEFGAEPERAPASGSDMAALQERRAEPAPETEVPAAQAGPANAPAFPPAPALGEATETAPTAASEVAQKQAEPPAPVEPETEATGSDGAAAHAQSPASPFEQALRSRQVQPQPLAEVTAERPHPVEPPAVHRKRRSRVMAPARSLRDFASKSWLSPRRLHRRMALAVAVLIAVSAAAGYFLVPRRPATQPMPPRPAAPAPVASAPEAPAPQAPPAQQAVPPANRVPAQAGPAAPVPAQGRRGLADLPPFVVDAEQDAEYGKTHPGWERYHTPRMEFKIFREGTLIKAVQIMAARDETVPADYFNWARKEFAGKGRYKLESKERKGNYEVEKWQADGAGLTVYRKVPDLKMRALVLYFR